MSIRLTDTSCVINIHGQCDLAVALAIVYFPMVLPITVNRKYSRSQTEIYAFFYIVPRTIYENEMKFVASFQFIYSFVNLKNKALTECHHKCLRNQFNSHRINL